MSARGCAVVIPTSWKCSAPRDKTALESSRRRTIIEDPPFRTPLQAVGDTDPEAIMAAYRGSVSDPVWSFLTRFDIADTVRQVVGVGSVGIRVYLVLLVE